MSIAEYLAHTLSPDANTRQLAEQYLENAGQADLPNFLGALTVELEKEGNDAAIRMSAGVCFKNNLSGKDSTKREMLQDRWRQINPQVRDAIKKKLLGALGTQQTKVGATVAQSISAVAQAELPWNLWPELIPSLLHNATDPASTPHLKQNTLECIGFICEEIDPNVLAVLANQILTAIVNGMRKEEPSVNVRLAATKALLNSLEFIKNNFYNEHERNFIMQIVCEGTQMQDSVELRARALECLVRIMQLYYDVMEVYMHAALFQLTLAATQDPNEEVAQQAIEFWSTVCDEEIQLKWEIMEAEEQGRAPSQMPKWYAKAALKHLIPILCKLLCQQEETDDEDAWNVATAAGVCISLLANACGNDIVPVVAPFISGNIQNPDWHAREASVLALGSVLEGPDEKGIQNPNERHLEIMVRAALPILTGLMSDPVVQVKDTTAWTIGRVCEYLPEVVVSDQNVLLALVEVLVNGLADQPRVASNVSWALHALAEQAYEQASQQYDDQDVETYMLSQYFNVIVQKLLETTERPDANESNLRSGAYEALMSFLQNSPADCYPTLQQTTLLILGRVSNALQLSSHQQHEKHTISEVLGLLCATLQVLLRKLRKADVVQISDQVMQILLYMLTSADQGGVQEDTLLAIDALVNTLEMDFMKYMPHFQPMLLAGLKNTAEAGVCSICVGIVGDLVRAFDQGALPYCDDFMTGLLTALQDTNLDRDVRPEILSCFGDVAMAIGPDFRKYVNVALTVLNEASIVQLPKTNYDQIDYLNRLRDGCLEAYTGIINAFKDDKEAHKQMQPFVQHIVGFVELCAQDPDATDNMDKAAIGILGDLVEIYGAELRPLLAKPWVDGLLAKGRRSKESMTKTMASWATEKIRKLK